MEPVLQAVRRPSYQQRKAGALKKSVKSNQVLFMSHRSFYERPLSLWNYDTPGVGAQLLSYLTDINKCLTVLEH